MELRPLSSILSIALLLPCIALACLSCTADKGKDASSDPDLVSPESFTLYEKGITPCSVLASSESEGDDIALAKLQSAFSSAYGEELPVIQPDEYTNGVTGNVIALGNAAAAFTDRAKKVLPGEGFCILPVGESLAVYASDSDILIDAVELFISKYVTDKPDGITLSGDLCLMRAFTPDSISSDKYSFTLPVLSVKTDNSRVQISKDSYSSGSATLCNTYDNFAFEDISLQIKGRGNGTWKESEKKPYKLKFDEKLNLLGVGASNAREWVLLSNPYDYTNLRNLTAFTLANEVFNKIAYTTGGSFVNLYLNGSYKGVYLVCDQPETGSGRIEINENEISASESDFLIILDDYADEWGSGNTFGIDYFTTETDGFTKKWLIKSDYNTASRCYYVRGMLTALLEAIEKKDEVAILSMIDEDSFTDMYLL